MMIKENSKTLSRHNTPNVFIMKYHDTDVMTFDKQENKLILKTGGWITKNTARAINFALQEQGIDVRVQHKSSRKTGLNIINVYYNDLILPLNERLEIKY